MKRIIMLGGLLIILFIVALSSGQIALRQFPSLSMPFGKVAPKVSSIPPENVRVVQEESVITNAVDTVSPSVVTVSIVKSRSLSRIFEMDPFDPFGGSMQPQGSAQKVEQDIGTGFIVSEDGMIVTNKHVVSDTEAKYKVITKDDKTYEAQKIYRDPTNDIAIIKISASGLKPVTLGDSTNLKVGQMAIAIGTALGEFRNTVTVGVISGLGRGIMAGSPIEGSAERLDNVIQTDAAINPGNSGGPLLNSGGQVIGINTAVSSEGQNIGFAIPINVVKEALTQFNTTGKFSRPYLGVRYKMITRDIAILNEVPEGAYVQQVVSGSPAEKAGITQDDIITKLNGKKVTDKDGGLAKVIADTKVGQVVSVELWRDNETKTISVTIGENTGE
jgi:serine protease Do